MRREWIANEHGWRADRNTRSYVTDYLLQCRVLCQGACRERLHLPHESPGDTKFIYRFESVNYPFRICRVSALPVCSDLDDFSSSKGEIWCFRRDVSISRASKLWEIIDFQRTEKLRRGCRIVKFRLTFQTKVSLK